MAQLLREQGAWIKKKLLLLTQEPAPRAQVANKSVIVQVRILLAQLKPLQTPDNGRESARRLPLYAPAGCP